MNRPLTGDRARWLRSQERWHLDQARWYRMQLAELEGMVGGVVRKPVPEPAVTK